MLQIEAKDQLREAFKFSRKIGMREDLKTQLSYLDTYAEHGDRGRTICRLYEDFAPHSFYFVMQVRDKETGEYRRWFNGGLIFHGSHDNGGDGGAPTLSVNLTPQNGWRVHT
ncbi:MAG: DUF4120 family protein [Planctomycetota bacterium]